MFDKNPLLVIGVLLCIPLFSCQITLVPKTDSDALADDDLEFLVTNTRGLIQVRDEFDQPWRFLESGDVLKPDCLVRTGFNSAADMVMCDNGRQVKVRLGPLLPEFELFDAYIKLFSPEACRKCIKDWIEKKGDCSGLYPLTFSRNEMDPVVASDFVSYSNLIVDAEELSMGRAAATGGGGGCPT